MNYHPNDLNSVKLLICYLLYNLEVQISQEELYDIAVNSGIINYFYYNEAIDELLINDTILSTADENGRIVITLSKKGIIYVKDFSSYVQLSFRQRLMRAAMEYKARKLRNAELSIEYEECENGCNLILRLFENSTTLIDMKLFAGSKTEAELIAEKISNDSENFYYNFINFIFNKSSSLENTNTEI